MDYSLDATAETAKGGKTMKDLHMLDKYRFKDYELILMGGCGNPGRGAFKLFVNGRSFLVIASNGCGWDHVSVSPCSQKRTVCPTWEEMSAIKDMFFEPEEAVVEYHPPKSEYVSNHPYCLHLWRPNDGRMIPMPPKVLV